MPSRDGKDLAHECQHFSGSLVLLTKQNEEVPTECGLFVVSQQECTSQQN